MSGKGSKQRPSSVDRETFASNWDAIFGKKVQVQVQDEVEDGPASDESSAPVVEESSPPDLETHK